VESANSFQYAVSDNTAELSSLWNELRATENGEVRAQLVDYYLPFARMLAAKMYAKRPYLELEFLDYFQYASIGLMESIDRFDIARGIKFETFAAARINGAMLNGVSTLSEKQEQVNARRRIVADRVDSLKELPPRATDADALFGYLAELAIGLAVGFVLDDSGMYQADEPSYPDNTYQSVELKQLCQQARTMLDSLQGNEKQVMLYHYLQQLAFDEIAIALGLSKGRISQIHQNALQKLRNNFRSGSGIDLRC
jgi:RNA polymerase sigma factor FliA